MSEWLNTWGSGRKWETEVNFCFYFIREVPHPFIVTGKELDLAAHVPQASSEISLSYLLIRSHQFQNFITKGVPILYSVSQNGPTKAYNVSQWRVAPIWIRFENSKFHRNEIRKGLNCKSWSSILKIRTIYEFKGMNR